MRASDEENGETPVDSKYEVDASDGEKSKESRALEKEPETLAATASLTDTGPVQESKRTVQ